MRLTRPVSAVPGTILGYTKSGRPIRAIAGGAPIRPSDLHKEAGPLAEQLKGYAGEQLAEVEDSLIAEFDAIYGDGSNADMDLAQLQVLSDQIAAVREERSTRDTAASERIAAANKLRDGLKVVNTTPEEGGDADPAEGEGDAEGGSEDAEEAPADQILAPLAASLARMVDATVRRMVPVEQVLKQDNSRSLNRHLHLSAAQRLAPNPQAPDGGRPGLVFASSSDIPGFAQGSALGDVESLARAMHNRARVLPVAQGNGSYVPVASMTRDFRYRLDLDSTPDQVNEILVAAMAIENLVAAGGWCAPSEINYDFFNIVAEDGMIDLPTAGVLNRGGIRYPVSPTFASIIAASPDGLWTWTETDDQAAVTGSPVKDCVRIPCPTFNEDRLVCEGLCVTAGNLVDYAYPENVQNFIRLIMAARAHLTNTRIIGLLESGSTAVNMTTSTTGNPEADNLLSVLMNAMDLQATDTRNRFAMANNAIVESVIPEWIRGALRTSFLRRTGVEDIWLADNEIISALDARNIRAQFVQDWQVRASGQPGFTTIPTAWPATAKFMMYAPGTWLRGQGLTLDLGVVRDSTLNQTNDHTAAWMEDCYSISKVGHESRVVTFNICVAGTTGAANVAC